MSLAVSTFPQNSAGINNHSWLRIHSGHQNTMNGHVAKSTTLFPMRVSETSAPLDEDAVSNGHNPTCSSNVTNSGISKNEQCSKPFASNGTLSGDKNEKKSVSNKHKERFSHKNTHNLDSSGPTPSTLMKAKETGKKLSHGQIPRYVKCFTCERIIKEDHFSEHLLFGSVKCSLCSSLFICCQSYQIWATEYALGNVICNHKFFYIGCPVRYLRKKISTSQHDNPLETDKLILIKNYINKLKSLEERPPWREAIRACKNFVEPHKSSNLDLKTTDSSSTNKDRFGITKRNELNASCSTYCDNDEGEECTNVEEECLDNFQDYDIEQLEKATEFVKVPDPHSNLESPSPKVITIKESETKKRKAKVEDLGSTKYSSSGSESMEYVPIPSSGFYYVSTKPIEECPNCYEMLCPSRFTVNVVTFLMTVICEGCDLTIYITSGAPEVQIVMENSKNTETALIVVNAKSKKSRGRPPKKSGSGKNFFKK